MVIKHSKVNARLLRTVVNKDLNRPRLQSWTRNQCEIRFQMCERNYRLELTRTEAAKLGAEINNFLENTKDEATSKPSRKVLFPHPTRKTEVYIFERRIPGSPDPLYWMCGVMELSTALNIYGPLPFMPTEDFQNYMSLHEAVDPSDVAI